MLGVLARERVGLGRHEGAQGAAGVAPDEDAARGGLEGDPRYGWVTLHVPEGTTPPAAGPSCRRGAARVPR